MPDPPEPPQQFMLTAEQLQQLLAGAAAVAAQNAGAGAGAAAAGQLAPCVLGREKTKRYQIFQDWITQAEAKMQFFGITEDGRKIAYLRSNVSDVYQVDVTSSRFTSLPTNLQYEVLNGLKVKRKQNSWAKIHQMPQEAEGFSGAPHTYLFYMTSISFLPGFQLERLKRRREIQAKLEGVVEEVEEQREVVDPKLFVGDRGGFKKLKTDSRRMVSRPDRLLVFMLRRRK